MSERQPHPAQPAQPAAARRRPGGRTGRVRDQVLRATIELIARHGLEGLQYEEIARVAGVNRATIHRNWTSRSALVQDALLRYAEESAPIPDTGDIEADLIELLCGLASVGETPVGQALMRIAMYSGEETALRELGLRTLDERLPALQARLDRAAERGELPPVDAPFLNELLAGPMHLRVTRARQPFGRNDARRVVDVVLSGVRATACDLRADQGEGHTV